MLTFGDVCTRTRVFSLTLWLSRVGDRQSAAYAVRECVCVIMCGAPEIVDLHFRLTLRLGQQLLCRVARSRLFVGRVRSASQPADHVLCFS